MKKVLCLCFLLVSILFLLLGCSDALSTDQDASKKEQTVCVYIDGKLHEELKTDAESQYKITPPQKPEDITSDPGSQKYFLGWFIDEGFQTRLSKETSFENGGAIYGKWLNVDASQFVYSVENGVAVITGFKNAQATEVVVPCYIDSYPVLSFNTSVFPEGMAIDSLILCDGITEVEGKRFGTAPSIKYVDFPPSITAIGQFSFYNCSALSLVTISDGVLSIGENAFHGCSGLTSFTIPPSVNSIGASAFGSCVGITSLVIPRSVASIGMHAFNGCTGLTSITILSKSTSIGASAFNGCSSLTSVTISERVVSIGNYAFSGCSSLSSISLPSSVTSIGEFAFLECSKLTSITLSSGVEKIGKGAFKDCTSLTEILIPDTVTTIGRSIFEGCNSLQSITVPFLGQTEDSGAPLGYFFATDFTADNDKVVPSSLKNVAVTQDKDIYDGAFVLCNSISSITLSDKTRTIGKGAFSGCTRLYSITIPDSVTTIQEAAFQSCMGLTSITLPSGVTEIAPYLFDNCISLTSITISANITGIGNRAFSRCSRLKTAVFENPVGWQYETLEEIPSTDLANESIAATYLTQTYAQKSWKRTN